MSSLILAILHFAACENGFVSVWEIPDGGLTENIDTPSVLLKGKLDYQAIYNLNYHASINTQGKYAMVVLIPTFYWFVSLRYLKMQSTIISFIYPIKCATVCD